MYSYFQNVAFEKVPSQKSEFQNAEKGKKSLYREKGWNGTEQAVGGGVVSFRQGQFTFRELPRSRY